MSSVNPAGGSGTEQGRDSWCTPKWLAKLVGRVFLDPCSNERSNITSKRRLLLERGDDGLYGAPGAYWQNEFGRMLAEEGDTTFVNCSYARGEVIKWVRHYRHTRFIFLLRWDPSTDWFSELIGHCTHVWFPNRRINFEPPPGVKSSSNPFPHALYLRNPPADLLLRLETSGYLIPLDGANLTPQCTFYESNNGDGPSGGGKGRPRAGRTKSSGGSVRGIGGHGLKDHEESDEGCSACGRGACCICASFI